MFNATTMCHLEEKLTIQSYPPVKSMWPFFSVLAWLCVYMKPLYSLFSRLPMNSNESKLLLQLASECVRFILVPMLSSYMFSKQQMIHIEYPKVEEPISYPLENTNETISLDTIDKSILHTLSRNPTGSTARMILQKLRPLYPELERVDILTRMEYLVLKKRVTNITGSVSSPMWSLVKIKTY